MSTSYPSLVLSCGILLVSPEGLFLAHATHTSHWDLPKGRQDPGETPWETAVREAREETGLDITLLPGHVQDLGRHAYIPKKKDLHVFLLELPQAFDTSGCHCEAMIEKNGKHFPEADAFKWVPWEDVPSHVGKSLNRLLDELGLYDRFTRPRRLSGPSVFRH